MHKYWTYMALYLYYFVKCSNGTSQLNIMWYFRNQKEYFILHLSLFPVHYDTSSPVPASQHKQTKKQTHGYLSYDICSQQYFSITNCFRKSIFIKKLDFCRQFSECFSFQLFILDVNKTNRRIREGWIQFGAGDIFVWLYQIALSTQSGLDVNKVLQTIQEARR